MSGRMGWYNNLGTFLRRHDTFRTGRRMIDFRDWFLTHLLTVNETKSNQDDFTQLQNRKCMIDRERSGENN